MTRARQTVNAWARRAWRLDVALVRRGSIQGGATWDTIYTPGRAGGWDGPARWSVTRAGAHVARRRRSGESGAG